MRILTVLTSTIVLTIAISIAVFRIRVNRSDIVASTSDDWQTCSVPVGIDTRTTTRQSNVKSAQCSCDCQLPNDYEPEEPGVDMPAVDIPMTDTDTDVSDDEEPVRPTVGLSSNLPLGKYFGAAVSTQYFGNRKYTDYIKKHCSIIVAENAMKLSEVYRNGGYTWSEADRVANLARSNDMVMRGHVLIWHNQINLGENTFDRSGWASFLKSHIRTMVRRYNDVIVEWDVVNEVFNDNGGFRTDSLWWRVLGEDYIEMAFRAARDASPVAKLYINDYSIAEVNTKSTLTYNLVKKLKSRGVPIDGVGFQMHISHNIDFGSVQRNINRFVALGVDVSFTEVDVFHRNRNDPGFFQDQARIYKGVSELFMRNDKIKSFLTWGVHDSSSWIPAFFGNNKGDPLLLDDNFVEKPAFKSVQNVLES